MRGVHLLTFRVEWVIWYRHDQFLTFSHTSKCFPRDVCLHDIFPCNVKIIFSYNYIIFIFPALTVPFIGKTIQSNYPVWCVAVNLNCKLFMRWKHQPHCLCQSCASPSMSKTETGRNLLSSSLIAAKCIGIRRGIRWSTGAATKHANTCNKNFASSKFPEHVVCMNLRCEILSQKIWLLSSPSRGKSYTQK